MATAEIKAVEQVWPTMATLLYVPHNQHEYECLVQILDKLIDEVGENEAHPLASLMEVLGVLIEKYEDEHVNELA